LYVLFVAILGAATAMPTFLKLADTPENAGVTAKHES
jgi:hypothetical protein